MDEITQSYNAFKIILELCEDRNYIVPEDYNNIYFETFRYLYNNKKNDIFCNKHKFLKKNIYIKFINSNKVKPNSIREIITNITTEYLSNEEDELIIVLKTKPNNSTLKIEKEKDYKHTEILWLGILQFNITKHNLVPKHSIVSKEELDLLLNKYNIPNIYYLPLISRDDVIVKYYNFKPGTVLKIDRISQTSATHRFYRIVK